MNTVYTINHAKDSRGSGGDNMDSIDYIIFNNDHLFHRKLINHFNTNDFKTICLHFKVDEKFYVPGELDYAEVDDDFDFELLKFILLKANLVKTDIAQLIMVFDTYDSKINLDTALEITDTHPYTLINFDELYFSIN